MNKLVLSDFDKTLNTDFSYFDVMAKAESEGLVTGQAIDEAQAALGEYKAKRADYEPTIGKLLTIQAAALEGIDFKTAAQSAAELFADGYDKYRDFVPWLLNTMRPDHDIMLITGEPDFVAQAVVAHLDLDGYRASEYGLNADDTFDGSVKRALAFHHEKSTAISGLLKRHGRDGSWGLGDSIGDSGMLGAVEHPLPIYPDADLTAFAEARDWPVTRSTEDVQAAVTRGLAA